jgi:ATP-binding protein involved in chromosome partitioning
VEEKKPEKEACPSLKEFQKEFKKHTGLKDVRFVIAVGSGKGGVGKTTVSAIISLALKKEGYSVGIFDLDFYGPNVSLVFGVKNNPPFIEFGYIKPVVAEGIKIMSIALMVPEKQPIFMRGLLASKLLQELIKKVEWGPLDFLILDLPPGTGDIFLTMLDVLVPDGFVLIATPHQLAISDAKRTLRILKENKIPIFGVVKNMADFFEASPSFEEFLKEERLPLLFEIPVLKELALVESIPEVFKNGKNEKILDQVAEKILNRVFRIH